MKGPGKGRTGFTTGACAAAAAKAAVSSIAGGAAAAAEPVRSVSISLPRGGGRAEFSIGRCERTGKGSVTCSVVKDAGDDPDVTHGAEIVASASFDPAGRPGLVDIDGGEGVGTVTKPGLGLDIGAPAINPVPRAMIDAEAREAGASLLGGGSIRIVVSVPAGRRLAPKTDNPRLGIAGGISILGTRGIVVPFSTAAFAASIRQSIDVAVAMGDLRVVLSTGGRSEEFARALAGLPDHCYVQMGDFSGYAVEQCAKKGIREAAIAGFIGKLAKMAAGESQTHVKGSRVDTALLARLAAEAGAPGPDAELVGGANTARHAMEIAGKRPWAGAFLEAVCRRACEHMQGRAARARGSGGGSGSGGGGGSDCGDSLRLEVVMFGFDGRAAARYPQSPTIIRGCAGAPPV